MGQLQEAAQARRRQLAEQLRTAELLSEPCPPNHWRWADIRLSGYGRKPEEELAADRLRNRQRATELRAAIAQLDAEMVAAGLNS